MRCTLLALPELELRRLGKDPRGIADLVSDLDGAKRWGDPKAHAAALERSIRSLSHHAGTEGAIALLERDLARQRSGGRSLPPALVLGKAWHALDVALGLKSRTARRAVAGVRPIGGDLGFGPAKFLGADEVASVAAELRLLEPRAALEVPFRAGALADVHGGFGTDPDDDDALEELVERLERLSAFYADAAAKAHAVVVALS